MHRIGECGATAENRLVIVRLTPEDEQNSRHKSGVPFVSFPYY
jgi:hypothetical protein